MVANQATPTGLTSDSSSRRYVAIAEQILELIRDEQIGPRLPSDRKLAETLKASRATVREALLALEIVGHVHIRHGDATYVVQDSGRTSRDLNLTLSRLAPVRNQDPRDALVARDVVERQIAALVAHDPNPSLGALKQNLATTEGLIDSATDQATFVDNGLIFHLHLADACTNVYLRNFVYDIMGNLSRAPLWVILNRQVMKSRDARLAQVHEHRGIVEAIEHGDAELAMSLMSAHIGALSESLIT